MINLKLTSKGAGDDAQGKPSLTTKQLLDAGLLKKAPKAGDKVELKLVNSAGIVAVQDFYASRGGDTLYAKEGFNDYLFDTPSRGNPVTVGCCGVVQSSGSTGRQPVDTGRGNAITTRVSDRPTSLSALKRLVSEYGTKVAAATSLGISVDTLRRLFKKAEANEASSKKTAKKSSSKKSSSSKKTAAPVKTTKSTKGGRGLTFETNYGYYTLSDIKKALKDTKGNKAAAADLLGTNPRTFGRWLAKAGI